MHGKSSVFGDAGQTIDTLYGGCLTVGGEDRVAIVASEEVLLRRTEILGPELQRDYGDGDQPQRGFQIFLLCSL